MDERRIREWDALEDLILDDVLEAQDLCDAGDYELALAACHELIEELDSWENGGPVQIIAELLMCSGQCLAGLDKFEEELAVYDELVKRFDSVDSSEAESIVCKGRFNAAVVTGHLGRTEESIRMYASLVKRYQDIRNPEIQSNVAKAWFNWADTLKHSSRRDEALAKLNELIARFEPILAGSEGYETVLQARLSKMEIEVGMRQFSTAIQTGVVGLEKCGKGAFFDERFHFHLILSGAYFIEQDDESGERHMLGLLDSLPKISESGEIRSIVSFLYAANDKIGVDRVAELILQSASAKFLSPVAERLQKSSRSLRGIMELARYMAADFSSSEKLPN